MPPKKNLNKYARYSGLAFEMLGIIIFGVFAGQKLDEKRQAEFPLFTVILSLLGVFAALYLVINDVIKNETKS
ncbi:MAG: AtpZ/AtpI family protein [Salinivirgaceae bacterium]|jgi:F0F1-type ATP synthase assembly protein I|nr:AtpZ/AtpI family protein [Salinivirgaceae bacterium]